MIASIATMFVKLKHRGMLDHFINTLKHLRDCTLQRFQATVYKQALKLPRSTRGLLVFLEMGRYPMQIQWLQRTQRSSAAELLEQAGC